MPQLDGLRAIAVSAVLYQHWLAWESNVGSWGVLLFFVLSGYLITGILVELRNNHRPAAENARRFFARRLLRLGPAYYLMLALAFAIPVPPDSYWALARSHWAWYAGYASNVLEASRGQSLPLVATWSLALEQQFYLVWFLVLMLCGVAWLRRGIWVVLAACLLFRFAVQAADRDRLLFLPFANVDALLLGAWLWVVTRVRPAAPGWAGPVALAIFGACCAATLWHSAVPERTLGTALVAAAVVTGICVASTLAAWRARSGFGGAIGAMLGNPVAVYLGRISYGIYLYHIVAPHLLRPLPYLWRFEDADGTLAAVCLHAAVTVGLAALSYHLLEQPLLARGRARAMRGATLSAAGD